MSNNVLTKKVIENNEFLNEFILETVKNSLPETLQKHLSKKSNREKMFEKYGKKAFLLPDQLKFPVMNPFTDQLDCRLIYAARIRAKQHKYKDVENQAEKLYSDNNCQSKINIELQDGTQIMCHELFDILIIES